MRMITSTLGKIKINQGSFAILRSQNFHAYENTALKVIYAKMGRSGKICTYGVCDFRIILSTVLFLRTKTKLRFVRPNIFTSIGSNLKFLPQKMLS